MPKKGYKQPKEVSDRIKKTQAENYKKKGFLHSVEVRKRLSVALTGNTNGKGNKGRISPMNDKKHSEETKKKMGETAKRIGIGKWNIGKSPSEEHKRKISESLAGSNHYRWNPDREEVKRNERNDGGYKQWVLKVKKRDNNQCLFKGQNCSGYNIVHHILSWKDYPELRYEIKNGITLCQAHHPRKRAEEKRLIPIFQGLVPVSS